MMNIHEQGLVENLNNLGCIGLALKLKDIFETQHVKDEDLLSLLANTSSDEVIRIRQERAYRLLKQAGLLNSYANLDIIEYQAERNLDKTLIDRLSTCDYIRNKANIIITGAAGTGKTFLAKAFAIQACNEGFRSRIFHLRQITKQLVALEKDDHLLYEKRLKYFSRIPLLVIDEWFSIAPSKNELIVLHELIDARYDRTSTIICSQMPKENWATFSGTTAIGEAITGRLSAQCFKIALEGSDIRTRHSERP